MNLPRRTLVLLPVICLAGALPAATATLTLDADTAAQMAVEASTLTLAAADRVEASQFSVKAADATRMPVLTVDVAVARQN